MILARKKLLLNSATAHEEIDSEGSWAISYGDMITLLLSFFIIFFTIDPTEKNTTNIKLKLSLIETLNEKSSALESHPDQPVSAGQKKESGFDPEILKEWNGIAHDKKNHVIIEFPGVSFFKSAETSLSEEGLLSLKKFVNVYMPYAGNYYVSIRAFADHRGIRSTAQHRFKDNLELTALRSVSTMRVLQKAGIPLSRIRVGGYGEHIVTAREIEEIPNSKRSPSSELDLARKVILVIEPEVINEKK